MPPELETSYIPEDVPPQKPLDDIAAISELITGGDSDESEPQQEAEAEQEAQQLPETAEAEETPQEEAAEPAEPSQIDYDLEVPMPDGMENMTVGQLKDHYRETQDLQQERNDWEAHQAEQQREMMVSRQKLELLARELSDVKPEVVAMLDQQMTERQQVEADKLQTLFPEWSDPEKKQAARTRHLETAREYGFSDAEYNAIGDHRIIKALEDLAQYRKREAAGKAKREQLKAETPKGQKPPTRKQSAAQQRAAMVQRAKRGSETDKYAAIGALISEG